MISGLLIFSAFLHALWNALAKVDRKTDPNIRAIMIVTTLIGWAMLPFISSGTLTGHGLGWTLLAGLFEAAYMVVLVLALDRNPLGLAYLVMRGGAMVAVWILSVSFLKESFHLQSLLGAALVLFGMAVSQFQPGVTFNKSIGWAYLGAVGIGGYHLSYGKALETGIHPAFLFTLSQTISVPIFLAIGFKSNFKPTLARLRERPVLLFAGGTVCYLSFYLFLFALAKSGAGFAITLRNTSILFAQFFSVFLGEKLRAQHWAGAILTLIGVTLISLY